MLPGLLAEFSEENPASSVPKAKVALEKLSEQQLIEMAQAGDKRAFGFIIRQHHKRLLRFIVGLVRSFDSAEDIVQEAFIRAYQALERFQPNQPFYPWLAAIARNLAFNHLQRGGKSESLDKLTESGYDPQSVQLGPMEQMLADENRRRYFKAVMALPAKYRAVFVLRHFEEMSYVDIASYLKIPPGTVDSRLYRARQMLMENLKDLL
jgi:RNA polymerase sigma-70 factor (ECF subfamily)